MAIIEDQQHRRELILRLKRVEGQLRGIQSMIESGDDCERVTQQLSAARRALDKTFFSVLACAIQSEPQKSGGTAKAAEERVKHAAAILAKFG